MITVYYRKVFPLKEESTFVESRLKKLDRGRMEKLLRTENREVKARHLSAGCLLHDALCERLGLCPESTPPFAIGYQDGGKPYLTERENIYFNLSHSGEYVCVAVGDGPVGVDIQKKTMNRKAAENVPNTCGGEEKIAGRFFPKSDRERLFACRSSFPDGNAKYRDCFFRIWSVRESYGKLTGEGLIRGFSDFEIDWQERRILDGEEGRPCARFWEWEGIENYSLCVCDYLPETAPCPTDTALTAMPEVLWKEMPDFSG